jgi:ribonuclease HI
MLAFESLLSSDYTKWIDEQEGEHSSDTPFGLIQSETLVPNPDWFFVSSYSPPNAALCRAMIKVNTSTTISKDDFISCLARSSCPPDSIEIYCDGSFSRDISIGSTGFVVFKDDFSSSSYSGGFCYRPIFSSYQSEMLAIRDSLRYIIEQEFPNPSWSKLRLFTDSKSALERISHMHFPSTHSKSPLEIELMSLLSKLSDASVEISLQWIPGHSGLLGNEQADLRAALAAQAVPIPVGIDLDYFHRRARAVQRSSWCYPDPPVLPLEALQKLWQAPYKLATLILRLATSHNYLRGCHWERTLLGGKRPRREAFLCRFCETEVETAAHLVNACLHPDVSLLRDTILWRRFNPDFPTRDLYNHCLLNSYMWKPVYSFFKSLGLNP